MKKIVFKGLSNKCLFIILFISLFSSCAFLKVIEKSSPQKPAWIHGIEKDLLIGEGAGKDYNEAKHIALQIVKEKIIS